jgi:hypothetical protein
MIFSPCSQAMVIDIIAKYYYYKEVFCRVIYSAVLSIIIILGVTVLIRFVFIFKQVYLLYLIIAGKATVTPIFQAIGLLFLWRVFCRKTAYLIIDIVFFLLVLAISCASIPIIIISISFIPTRSICPIRVVYPFA